MDYIPKKEDWQNLPGKSARKEALINIRREFDDKEIRISWGMKPASYYQLIQHYGLGGRRPPGRPPTLPSEDDDESKEPIKREFRRFEDVDDGDGESVEPQHELSRRTVIDAEYEVMNEEPKREATKPRGRKPKAAPITAVKAPSKKVPKTKTPAAPKEPEPQPEPSFGNRFREKIEDEADSVGLPFPAIKGSPAQLRKQFEAVVLFLEGREGEDSRYEIRLSAVKVEE